MALWRHRSWCELDDRRGPIPTFLQLDFLTSGGARNSDFVRLRVQTAASGW